MPTAGEFCNRRVVTARTEETLSEVAARMQGQHVGSVVVVDKVGRQLFPIGMLTDRDIVVGLLARANRRLDSITVGDVMSTEPITAREGDDLSDLLKRMQSAGVRRVPIVGEAGALIGVVAFDDVVGHVAEQMSTLAQVVSRGRATEEHARPFAAASKARRPSSHRPSMGSKPSVRVQPPAKGRAARTGRTLAGRRRRAAAR